MGCNASTTQVVAPHEPRHIRILVGGPAGTGKSAFARRFCTKQFDEEGGQFTTGSRLITVNDEDVKVSVTNVGTATPEQIAHADGVVFTVRGNTDSPFDGLYRYIDALHLPVLAESAQKRTCSGETWASKPTPICADDVGSVSLRSNKAASAARKNGLHPHHLANNSVVGSSSSLLTFTTAEHDGRVSSDAVAPSSDGTLQPLMESPSSHEQCSLHSPDHSAGASDNVGTGGGACGEGSVGFRERRRSKQVPDIFHSLSLDTGSPLLTRGASGDTSTSVSSTTRAPPMAVVVTCCDVVDEQAESNPRALVRLRAMAANWSSANRCRVTFVSSKSGVGVNSALAHLIKQIYNSQAE